MSKSTLQRYLPQVPDGWVKCPRFGDPRFFEGLNIIPCKVPLSHRFDKQVGPSGRWTLVDAIRQFRGYGMEIATIIDLTKSRNYYDIGAEMDELGRPPINYVKIACRGRGEAPQPAEVNEAVWHIFAHHAHPEAQSKYILLHCTHGFNRTGFVIVAALLRLRKNRGMTVRRALDRFAASRPPGIYKDHYINDLYKYYHEARDFQRTVTPAVPRWKGNDDAEDAADAANEDVPEEGTEAAAAGDGAAALPPVVNHEDIWSIGERVCEAEADYIRQQVCRLLPFEGGGGRGNQQLRFPGMQPVSLSIDRLRDLPQHRYWVTWKADGTRYMVFILSQGTYIMDRSFNVVRCEMRFMNGVKRPPPGHKVDYPVGKPVDVTLLDGEMVVDHDPEGKQPPRLRYLIYDMCMINQIPLIHKPWKERYRAVESDVVAPRNQERKYNDDWRGRAWDASKCEYNAPPLGYNYAAEPFSVRQKPFWPVFQIDKVFQRFNDPQKVGHESDGLILQGMDHPYNAGTCELLYKWKFAHMNSVDFLLRCATVPGPEGGPARVLDPRVAEPLELFLLDQATSRGARINLISLAKVDRDGHYRVEFPAAVDPLAYEGKLVECTFDRDRGLWMFMRERKDKDTPNGSKVYHRIKESIINHVDQDLLVGTLKDALLHQECYSSDRAALSPAQLEGLRRETNAWLAHMEAQEEQRRQQQHPMHHPPPHHDDLEDGGADGEVGPDHDGADGDEGGAYRVSDADPEADGGAAKRPRTGAGPGELGDGEGRAGADQEQPRARRRETRWPSEVDLPHPLCPAYEGFGFD